MSTSGLARLLVKTNLLSKSDSQMIARDHSNTGAAFAKVVVAVGILSEEGLAKFLAKHTSFAMIPHGWPCQPDPEVRSLLDPPLLQNLEVVPLSLDGHTLKVAMADPLDQTTLQQLSFFTSYKIKPVIASFSSLYMALDRMLEGFKPQKTSFEEFLAHHIKPRIVSAKEGRKDGTGAYKEMHKTARASHTHYSEEDDFFGGGEETSSAPPAGRDSDFALDVAEEKAFSGSDRNALDAGENLAETDDMAWKDDKRQSEQDDAELGEEDEPFGDSEGDTIDLEDSLNEIEAGKTIDTLPVASSKQGQSATLQNESGEGLQNDISAADDADDLEAASHALLGSEATSEEDAALGVDDDAEDELPIDDDVVLETASRKEEALDEEAIISQGEGKDLDFLSDESLDAGQDEITQDAFSARDAEDEGVLSDELEEREGNETIANHEHDEQLIAARAEPSLFAEEDEIDPAREQGKGSALALADEDEDEPVEEQTEGLSVSDWDGVNELEDELEELSASPLDSIASPEKDRDEMAIEHVQTNQMGGDVAEQGAIIYDLQIAIAALNLGIASTALAAKPEKAEQAASKGLRKAGFPQGVLYGWNEKEVVFLSGWSTSSKELWQGKHLDETVKKLAPQCELDEWTKVSGLPPNLQDFAKDQHEVLMLLFQAEESDFVFALTSCLQQAQEHDTVKQLAAQLLQQWAKTLK